MSIHVALNHVTHYRYDRPIALGPQIVRLRPAPHARTPILAYSQRVAPAKHFINWQQDPQSNWLARLVFPEPARELRIEVDLVAEMSVINPFDFFLEPRADNFPFHYEESQLHELAPYLQRGALDYYQWTALLRSVSSYETYRGLYRDQILPIKVAQLLILERRMPRSLAACFDQITQAMEKLEGQDRAAKRLASELHARLTNADIEEIFQDGLHEYLTECIADMNELAVRIQRAYLGTA